MNVIWRYIVAAWRGELSLLTAILGNGVGGFAAFVVLGLLSAITEFKPVIYAVIILYLVWAIWAFIGIVRSAIKLAKTGKTRASKIIGATIALVLVFGFLILATHDVPHLLPHH